jgi:polysaccharide biosynthesis protein PslH
MTDRPASRRLRLLFLLPFTPRFDARHGGRTTTGLVAKLAERHDVALLCLRSFEEDSVDERLRQRCVLVAETALPASRPARRMRLVWSLLVGRRPMQASDAWSPSLWRRAREVVTEWRPDVVHVELAAMGRYLDAVDGPAARVLLASEPASQTALDLFRAARGSERVIRYLDLRAWRRFERETLRRVDAVVCYTERDRRVLSAIAPNTTIETIPARVELPDRPLDPCGSHPPSVLFVGGFGHPPNVDAAVRLAAHIFPAVVARRPESMLYLVGDKPPRKVESLASEQVVVTGRVDDVTPYLDRAAVVVAPLRLGGGVRVKVLEALAAGKAVVASRLAAAGLDTGAGDHLVIADGDMETVEAICGLLADPAARAALGRRARRWAERELDWDRTLEAYESLYARLLTARNDRPERRR